ncbi:MAG TPA: NIPSNAP family protein [Povalibacter sp.]|nr:NIPSNAP family protein [Povalibacter sp.]
MFVDHRTYTIPHGRMKEYLQRYESVGLALQRRYLGHHIGCYVSEIGALEQVIHMWGFASMADREARRERMDQDPEWQAFRQMIAGTFSAQETKILRATSFSPQMNVATNTPLR